MNPTLYDILGVPEDAGRDEIKRSWRDAADRFEPGSGGSSAQFRLFNEAAEVLLDPVRREEYDAHLAADRTRDATPSPAPATSTEPAPVTGFVTESVTRSVIVPVTGWRPALRPPVRATGRPSRGLPLWSLAVLGLVTAVAVGVAAYFWQGMTEASAVEETRSEAPAAAERAAAAVLSYDHESLTADRDKAARFLTGDYRSDYLDTFNDLVTDAAEKTRAKVEAQIVASAVSSAEPGAAKVVLFVNQTTNSTANEGEPQTALNRVVFDMVQVDDSWLVDGITSY